MDEQPLPDQQERNRRIAKQRDDGATWKEIQEEFGLTRQQARHGYQLGKREQRRKERREG